MTSRRVRIDEERVSVEVHDKAFYVRELEELKAKHKAELASVRTLLRHETIIRESTQRRVEELKDLYETELHGNEEVRKSVLIAVLSAMNARYSPKWLEAKQIGSGGDQLKRTTALAHDIEQELAYLSSSVLFPEVVDGSGDRTIDLGLLGRVVCDKDVAGFLRIVTDIHRMAKKIPRPHTFCAELMRVDTLWTFLEQREDRDEVVRHRVMRALVDGADDDFVEAARKMYGG